MRLRARLAWVAVPALGLVACNAVFGMDPPTLAQCANGCPDGASSDAPGADTTLPDAPAGEADAPAEGTADAPVDGMADTPSEAPADGGTDGPPDGPQVGIRCGGGGFPESWCSGATPECCQGGTSVAPTFDCVANQPDACAGYVIRCADYNDCSGSEICCRFMAHQVCDQVANCPNSELVCDQATLDTCPSGWKCNVPFVGDSGASSPYLGCSP